MEVSPDYNTPLPWQEPPGPDGIHVHLTTDAPHVSTKQGQAKPSQPMVRRCVRGKCGHSPLPLRNWYANLCPKCLGEVHAAQRGQWQQQDGLLTKARPAKAQKTIVTCYFCPTRVVVPPGESPDAPLLCGSCFQRAITAKQSLVPTSLPSHIHRPPTITPGDQTQVFPPEHHLDLSEVMLHPPKHAFIARETPPALKGRADSRSIAQNEPMSLPQASVSTTDQPMDVDDDLDDLKLEYPSDDPDSIKATSQPPEDTIKSCGVQVPSGWESEMSALTDLSDSDDEGKSEADPDPGPSRKTGLKLRIRLPPGFSFDKLVKPRQCGFKTCKGEIEPGSRWKLCQPCRAKFRKYQRERLGVTRPRPDAELDARGMGAGKEKPEEYPDGIRACTGPHCHTRLPPQEEYQWLRCKSCRNRHRFQTKRRRVISLIHGKPPRDGEESRGGLSHHIINEYNRQKALREKAGLQDEEVVHPVRGQFSADTVPPETATTKLPTTFQSCPILLSNLQFNIAGFLKAQAMYVRAQLERGSQDNPLQSFRFSFSGAFALVAGGELNSESTIRMLLGVRKGIENVLGVVLRYVYSSTPMCTMSSTIDSAILLLLPSPPS
ncbi:hypothetical protein OF83DRAFT_1144847 [Amylostereum chailletii]|nr:hypothetical protein OF83DRAFT_1144847 [Amylostereum chailletii]